MRNTVLDVHPVSGAVGAEILGIDLNEPHPDAVWGEIRATLNEYGVVFFRDQRLTPDGHAAFARRFGRIHTSPFLKGIDGHPEIGEVRKEPEQSRNIGGGWHTDHAYNQAPALGSILVARELPDHGGDTLFAGMGAAYDALSDGLKATLEGLRAIHSNEHVFGPKSRANGRTSNPNMVNLDAATMSSNHPVVVRHPETGRKVLFVNPGYTVRFDGWTEAESAPLLKYLYQHAARPEFTCRFRWREGSVAFWDNRQVWHYAVNDYHGHRRLMHRITIAGVELG